MKRNADSANSQRDVVDKMRKLEGLAIEYLATAEAHHRAAGKCRDLKPPRHPVLSVWFKAGETPPLIAIPPSPIRAIEHAVEVVGRSSAGYGRAARRVTASDAFFRMTGGRSEVASLEALALQIEDRVKVIMHKRRTANGTVVTRKICERTQSRTLGDSRSFQVGSQSSLAAPYRLHGGTFLSVFRT